MRSRNAAPIRHAPTPTPTPPPPERMWPLDLTIASLAGLVLYLIVSRLRFDDPRWQYNGWTYAIAVPTIALLLAFLLHGIASRYVQKSIQLGFLFSVFVHLLLLLLAINMIIFSPFFPTSLTGVKPERSPVRRTVPEYLFQTPEKRATQPDWSKPVNAETASKVIPKEARQLPPLEHSAVKLEVPRPRDPVQRPAEKFLIKRKRPSESVPQPSDAASRLARRRSLAERPLPSLNATSSPRAPEVPAAAEIPETIPERPVAREPQGSTTSATTFSAAAPADLPIPDPVERSLAGARRETESLPAVGDLGAQPQRSLERQSDRPAPAGASPAPPTVAVARHEQDSHRALAPLAAPLSRQSESAGARLTVGASSGLDLAPVEYQAPAVADLRRSATASRAGMPVVTAGQTSQVAGRTRRPFAGTGMSAAGLPASDVVSDPAPIEPKVATGSSETPAPLPLDRVASLDRPDAARRQRGAALSSVAPSSGLPGPSLDLLLDEGPVGLGATPSVVAGVVPSLEQPQVAALELSRGSRERRDVGGPITPFGTKVAAVESFNRRVMRTQGGAAPTPAGTVGPATEQAIERGLAFLADAQRDDGSWSLQGHGTDVVLRSDTAATGLCLLAFQGAGYTHRQHQYADTVSRALAFLIENQQTNGDLYRPEDATSNQNVALYSHGIAALGLSEAYGMTQDEELRDAAQTALNYIAATQHRQRGGWRYTPQVSADTSVTGWMMMALKSGQLAGLDVPPETYRGIDRWLDDAQPSPDRNDRYSYNPYAPDTPTQRHGRRPTPTMTAVGMLMRMYSGWRRDTPAMQSAAAYLAKYPPQVGTPRSPQRDTYYWYYATQVMFHMGGDFWDQWSRSLNPALLDSQETEGAYAGSWDPINPVPDRWSPHAGRLYVTTMNLLNLEVYYRHLPIYEDTAPRQ